MPLSTFLMMHGCSMAETARDGMGSHGAGSGLALAALTSRWLLLPVLSMMDVRAGLHVCANVCTVQDGFRTGEKGSKADGGRCKLQRAACSGTVASRLSARHVRRLGFCEAACTHSRLAISSRSGRGDALLPLLRLGGVHGRTLGRTGISTSSHHAVALSWHVEPPTRIHPAHHR